ncbi:PDX1 [Candida oxycetoniae]|uniref:Dihydrolipoamide dehydrogenase-binding protein of pyruvate dehydrogenase complex n=1 Tax=Candida oxycetoniae TaxID=497107 RepID=A0AAI9WYI9_9ASCO|nr:PDX1 [Candida oxycetoniae]KAI3405411.2 PDX1 [Candida oxycetoniae]
MFRVVLERSCIGQSRWFHRSSIRYAASLFRMPAMSPTMTEGGIVSWKVKPGDSFNAGDVLLEVETDKATIDVEAADDGKMWEILEKDGANGIPVGKPIAFLAEVDDDLNSLEKPKLEEQKETKEQQKPEEQKETKEQQKPKEQPRGQKVQNGDSAVTVSSNILQTPNPNQKFSPSVELLLNEYDISKDTALVNIKASGPNGRILKGDVLAYLGKINEDSIEDITKFLKSRQHLDLSNVVPAKPSTNTASSTTTATTATTAAATNTAAAATTGKETASKPKPTNILSVELSTIVGENHSKDKFKHAFEKSIQSAIKYTYQQKFPQFANSPSESSVYDKYDLFEELISPSVTKNRFEVYDIKYKFYSNDVKPRKIEVSDFDEILGTGKTPVQYLQTDTSNVQISFKIKIDEKLPDARQFVEEFENFLLSQVSASKLKITS